MVCFFKKKEKVKKTDEVPEKEVLRRVQSIQIRSSRMVTDLMAGEYRSAFKGRGMEFDSVREYIEGDDPRTVDWNVTARLGYPYVKSYIEEREMSVVFLVDVSASGQFGSGIYSRKEVIAELCGVLAFNAMRLNDKVGALLFSDRVEKFIPPRKGRTHVLRLIRELLCFQPSHTGTSIQNALVYMNRLLRKRAVLFLVSDFLDSGFEKEMSIANRRHDLVALEVCDKWEKEPPDLGVICVEDLETGIKGLVDTHHAAWRKYYSERRGAREEKMRRMFRRHRVDHLLIQMDQPFDHQLTCFFKKRSLR